MIYLSVFIFSMITGFFLTEKMYGMAVVMLILFVADLHRSWKEEE